MNRIVYEIDCSLDGYMETVDLEHGHDLVGRAALAERSVAAQVGEEDAHLGDLAAELGPRRVGDER